MRLAWRALLTARRGRLPSTLDRLQRHIASPLDGALELEQALGGVDVARRRGPQRPSRRRRRAWRSRRSVARALRQLALVRGVAPAPLKVLVAGTQRGRPKAAAV